MQAFTQTALLGGTDGTFFNDACFVQREKGLALDSERVPGDANILDVNHPIQEIRVAAGWIVDGITIDYVTKSHDIVTRAHGSQFPDTSLQKVTLGASEKVISVFGRAGYQSHYRRSLVNSIGFVLFDSRSVSVRVVGPFGNDGKQNEGEPFNVSGIVAFGGFAQSTTDSLGLSGLFFIKYVD